MRFNLLLHTNSRDAVLPVNYHYPLSAAIYQIIRQADPAYAAFLHDHGYTFTGSLKSFDFFTFSDLRTPFKISRDRLILKSKQARVILSFQLPDPAEAFLKDLFTNAQLEIADRESRVCFQVREIESLPLFPTSPSIQKDPVSILLQPLSPIVTGLKNQQGHYDYLPPGHPQFIYRLIQNWKEKYRVIYPDTPLEALFEQVEVKFLPHVRPPRSRLITIKAHTPEETKIRGFDRFNLHVSAPVKALELVLNAGMGLYNALGMGCMEARTVPGASRS